VTRYQQKFFDIAQLCDVLAQSAPTPDERDNFMSMAEKWRALATGRQGGGNLHRDTLSAAHRSATNALHSGVEKPSGFRIRD